jgi:hypothetical protein
LSTSQQAVREFCALYNLKLKRGGGHTQAQIKTHTPSGFGEVTVQQFDILGRKAG